MFSQDSVTAEVGGKIYPLEMGYLPEIFQKKAEDELRYTVKVRENALLELKNMMTEDNTTKSIKLQDEILLMFLNSRKYDVSQTFKLLKKFLAFRKKNTNMFNNISFESISCLVDVVIPLPWRCQDGCSIFLIDLENWNYERHQLEPIKQMYLVCLLMGLREPMAQVNGYKAIIDLNVTADFLKLGTPNNLYTLYYGTQVLLPARFKEIHLINMGVIGKIIFKMIRIFFSEKIKNRIHMHATTDSLLEYFPKAVIPSKYGGDLKDYDMTDWLKRHTSPEELSLLDMN